MTWQRIDENTYIDDTLVTCAEYQLFIDEMREKGKYCQPDHWISYQYPIGHAQELILGMNHTDAMAFCEWLSFRGNAEWNYRLPKKDEANAFPMRFDAINHFGYWIDKVHQFIWIGSTPGDACDIDRTLSLDLDRARDLAHFHALDLNRDRDLNSIIINAHTLARIHPLDRDTNFSRARKIDGGLERDLVFDLSRNISIRINPAITLDRDRELALALALTLTSDSDYHLALAIYIDLFILQERISGRSPAIEGIRLVKERIR
jgi:hypothetical protein